MALNGGRYDVRIDELVLRGFPAGQRDRIVAAFEREFHRLLAREGLTAPASRHIDRLAVPPIELRGRQTPAQVGRHIARTVHRGLNHGRGMS